MALRKPGDGGASGPAAAWARVPRTGGGRGRAGAGELVAPADVERRQEHLAEAADPLHRGREVGRDGRRGGRDPPLTGGGGDVLELRAEGPLDLRRPCRWPPRRSGWPGSRRRRGRPRRASSPPCRRRPGWARTRGGTGPASGTGRTRRCRACSPRPGAPLRRPGHEASGTRGPTPSVAATGAPGTAVARSSGRLPGSATRAEAVPAAATESPAVSARAEPAAIQRRNIDVPQSDRGHLGLAEP